MSSSSKEYSVNWKNHMSHVRQAFESLLSASELTDVVLYCEGKKIPVHRVVLSACSAYFRDIFKNNPYQSPIIIIPGVEYGILNSLIRFIYQGEVSVDTTKLDAFLKTAQLLKINGLTERDEKIVSETEESSEPQEPEQQSPSTPIVEDVKRPFKRARQKEPEIVPEKLPRQEEESFLISDVKCEPTELSNFDDPLEDNVIEEEESALENMDNSSNPQKPEEQEYKQEFTEIASKDTELLLPTKSKQVYEESYTAFKKWCVKNQVATTTEESILAYFNTDLALYKASSLWSKYSMLRSTINLHEDVDISKFPNVVSYLKRKAEGYTPKKALILSKENVNSFLLKADDELHLLNKVILIFGVAGSCRRQELVSLMTTNVEDCENHFLVKVMDEKSIKDRSFMILPGKHINLLEIIRKYILLRSKTTPHTRFFTNYVKGKCTTQAVGINKIGGVPSVVAKFLNLPNASSYTGHSFRRTFASLNNSVGGITDTMRFAQRRSNRVSGRCIEDIEAGSSGMHSEEM